MWASTWIHWAVWDKKKAKKSTIERDHRLFYLKSDDDGALLKVQGRDISLCGNVRLAC